MLQPYYDVRKLFEKEKQSPTRYQDFYIIAYLVFLIGAGAIFFAGGDLLLVIFTETIGSAFLIIAAYSSNSPYAEVGAERELLQMMAYEPMILLTAVGFYLSTGSFKMADIIQTGIPPVVRMPGFFAGFCFILVIKLRKSPFDIATSHHAHQEIIKGLTGDLSGRLYGLSELAELYEEVLMLGMTGLFFITSDPISIIYALIAVAAVMFVMSLTDNIFPRVKWEMLLKLAWLVTFFAGGSNLLLLTLI